MPLSPSLFWRENAHLLVPAWTQHFLHLRAQESLSSLAEDGKLDACLPDVDAIFRAFDLLAPEDCRVVLLGQDPYPSPEDAMGLAFSSPAPKLPASLRNIFKELEADLGISSPQTGDLTHWTRQGVLLANAALTIGADGKSHGPYWLRFTRQWVTALAARHPVVWILWGNQAQNWKPHILVESNEAGIKHAIIESAHPSPLSAYRGFFGSRPFSRANAALREMGRSEICWGASEI